MTSKLVSPELRGAMKRLRLGKLLDTLDDRIALAEKESLRLEDFLLMLFSDEVERRNPLRQDSCHPV
jgi:hypothetical protein